MASRSPTTTKRRKTKAKSKTWKDISQSVKPKAMSSASERRVLMSRLKIAGCVLAVIAVVAAALQFSSVWREAPELLTKAGESLPIKTIEIETDGSLSRVWVNNHLDLGEEANLLSVDISGIESKLKAIGQVKKVEVERRFPDTLRVLIEERRPVARMVAQRSNGERLFMYVDADGILFESEWVEPATSNRLPYLEVKSLKKVGDRYLPVDDVKPAMRLLEVASGVAPHIYGTWRVLTVSESHRISVSSPRVKEAIFHAKHDYIQQLARLDYILDYYRTRQSEPIGHVDLTLGDQVPVKSLHASR